MAAKTLFIRAHSSIIQAIEKQLDVATVKEGFKGLKKKLRLSTAKRLNIPTNYG